MKVCTRCATVKPLDEFYPRGGKFSSWCRPCTRTYTLDWRKKYPGRRRAHVL